MAETQPTLWTTSLCHGADANEIPEESESGTGYFSFKDGFPQITSISITAGGVAPRRMDFNGVLKLLGDNTWWQQHGGQYAYNADYDYSPGMLVRYDGTLYICIATNGPTTANAVAPGDTAYWQAISTNDKSTVGSATNPVYLNAGNITACSSIGETIASMSAYNRNQIYRGKNLGTISSESDIEDFLDEHEVSSAKFTDLFIGDYLTISDGTYNKNWCIADFDYWYLCGPTSMTSHHLAMIPMSSLVSAQMNTSNTTEGGYAGSAMHTTTITENVVPALDSVLGDHLLTFYDYLSSTVNTDVTSSAYSGWTGATSADTNTALRAVLLYDSQVFGYSPYAEVWGRPSNPAQLSVFKFKQHNNLIGRTTFWLRNVAMSSRFAAAYSVGACGFNFASTPYGVVPLILVG